MNRSYTPSGARPRTATAGKRIEIRPSRVMLVLGIIGIFFLALIIRGIYMQTVQQSFLQNQGDARFKRALTLVATRGPITDRNGDPLALSTPVKTIWASPKGMAPVPQDKVLQLAQLLEMPAEVIDRRLNERTKEFVYIKRQISPALAEKVMALGIPGIAEETEYRRYYPAGDTVAHIIGFTGVDGHGQEGLELTRDKMLAGKDGSRTVLKDRRGHIVEDLTAIEPPKNGQALTLSVDRRIQYLAFRELKNAVEVNKAKAGSVVVLDGKTGEVLAMANYPSFNPNNRANLNPEMRRNRAVIDMTEPGSTMKPFPVSLALDSGKVTPNTLLDTKPYMIGPATVRDSHPARLLTVWQVIQKSSNVGASKMGLMFPPETMWKFYDEVGFGRSPHAGFPGEVSGRLRDWHNWRPIEQATMSFGYGVSVSLLQLARAYTIFTDDGVLLPVTFTKIDAAPPGRQVIRPETAKEMRQIMTTVTEPGGTGLRARVVGYNVAGKSGTARKLVDGRYAANKHVGLFIGYAPATRPKLIVAVMIDEPTGGSYYGGTVAGPAFSNIMAGSLRILGVEPDAPTNTALIPEKVPEIREDT